MSKENRSGMLRGKVDEDYENSMAVLALGKSWLEDAFEKAQEQILEVVEADTPQFEKSPLVGAKEVFPAKTMLFVQATKEDFRTINVKGARPGPRRVFDCRLITGALKIVRKKGDPIDIKAGEAMTIMLGEPDNPSPSKLYKQLVKQQPFKDKELAIVNLGKKPYKGITYWDFRVVPAERIKALLEKKKAKWHLEVVP